jgi:hypothetical protein
MADIEQALQLVTDPANVARMGATGPEQRFTVNSKRVIRALRDAGAGKAEARELALEALEKVGGAAEVSQSRGAQRGARGERHLESWWVPEEAVRFQES